MFNEFKMFNFRCAKFDSTPTPVQIWNKKIPLLDLKLHIEIHIVMEHVPSHLDRCLSIDGNVHALYAHIILKMSLTHSVKLEQKLNAQII
jgi:hypothetical protein